jgi:hypothetical protein
MDDDVNKIILDAEIEAEEDGILDDPYYFVRMVGLNTQNIEKIMRKQRVRKCNIKRLKLYKR